MHRTACGRRRCALCRSAHKIQQRWSFTKRAQLPASYDKSVRPRLEYMRLSRINHIGTTPYSDKRNALLYQPTTVPSAKNILKACERLLSSTLADVSAHLALRRPYPCGALQPHGPRLPGEEPLRGARARGDEEHEACGARVARRAPGGLLSQGVRW